MGLCRKAGQGGHTSSRMSRALLLTSGWRALGSMANRSLNVPANLQPAACSAMSGERMQQLAERLSPVSASLVSSSRGFATSTIRRSDEEKGPVMDQAAMSSKVDPAEAAAQKAAAAKAAAELAAKKAAAEKRQLLMLPQQRRPQQQKRLQQRKQLLRRPQLRRPQLRRQQQRRQQLKR